MKNIPTELLRTFVTIKDLGGFTSAGELLGRSQPAISLQIKRLEEILDTKVFLRGPSLTLTADGENVYSYAKEILALNDSLMKKLRGENVTGKVRLGIPSDLELAFLPKALKSFSKIYPNISVEVDCEISKTILQRYQQNFYDIILIMEPVNKEEKRDSRDYRIERLEWVMAPDYLVSEDDEVSLVSYPQGCVYRNITENLLATKNIAYKTTYTSTNLLGLLSAVEAGLGLTVMARSTVPGRVKSVSKILSVPELDPVCIGLYYKEHEISAAAQRVVDFLRAGIANLEKIRL